MDDQITKNPSDQQSYSFDFWRKTVFQLDLQVKFQVTYLEYNQLLISDSQWNHRPNYL